MWLTLIVLDCTVGLYLSKSILLVLVLLMVAWTLRIIFSEGDLSLKHFLLDRGSMLMLLLRRKIITILASNVTLKLFFVFHLGSIGHIINLDLISFFRSVVLWGLLADLIACKLRELTPWIFLRNVKVHLLGLSHFYFDGLIMDRNGLFLLWVVGNNLMDVKSEVLLLLLSLLTLSKLWLNFFLLLYWMSW